MKSNVSLNDDGSSDDNKYMAVRSQADTIYYDCNDELEPTPGETKSKNTDTKPSYDAASTLITTQTTSGAKGVDRQKTVELDLPDVGQ